MDSYEAVGPLDMDDSRDIFPHHDTSRAKFEVDCRPKDAQRFGTWLRPFSVGFAALFLVTILIRSLSILSIRSGVRSFLNLAGNDTPANSTNGEMLGIRLNPQNHASRQPQIITHTWTITSDIQAPDGVEKLVYMVNGQFPGPTIECRSGDRLVILVRNSLQTEGISIHWHGLEMRNANNMDGAIGISQCPVPPGEDFTYEFDIGDNEEGTFWWHAHSQVQRGDGLFGGLIIHRPDENDRDIKAREYDEDVLVMIGDWYHRSAEEVLAWYTSTRGFGNEPVPDSLLVNGAGRFICSMALQARPVQCTEIDDSSIPGLLGASTLASPVRMRLVNVGSLAGFTVHISSAKVVPLTVDGGSPVTRIVVDSVGILYPGERLDVLVIWDKEAAENCPHFHVSLDPENFKFPNRALRPNQSFPVLSSNTATPSTSALEPVHVDLAALAGLPNEISTVTDQVILLYAKTQKLSIDSNHPAGFMNRTSWSPQTTPPFPLVSLPRSQWDDDQLVPYIIPTSNTPWVDIVINNLDDGAHPFHLHGYTFYVIASFKSDHGWGSYSPYSTSGSSAIQPTLNLLNPLKKDTVSIPRRGYVILRLKADNEGIWMLHCHVLFHQASGMAMAIQVGGGERHEQVDASATKLCRTEP